MKKYFLIIICGCNIASQAQSYYSINQTQINQTQINQVNNVGPSDYSIMYAVYAFMNIYYDKKREKIAQEKALTKVNMLKQNYKSNDSFPESILTGWHNVIVTDNLRFCGDAKVFVNNNKIQVFVIDNCIRLNFAAAGKIKNGKNTITLNKFNGEQLEIADVYFIFDLEEPTFTSQPINPGFVCFWTKKNKYLNRNIAIDQIMFDGVSLIFNKMPECSSNGTVSLLLKPGLYSYRVLKRGKDIEGSIEIKSDQCLTYELK